MIDGILCEEKKKEDRDVIITGAELEKFFGKMCIRDRVIAECQNSKDDISMVVCK